MRYMFHDDSQLKQICTRNDHTIDMLIILLFIARVGCEWVEISQQHYVKPLRPVHLPSPSKVNKEPGIYTEETTKRNRFFNNHSLSENSWNRATFAHGPNVGNVRRVQLASYTEKVPIFTTSTVNVGKNSAIENIPPRRTTITKYKNYAQTEDITNYAPARTTSKPVLNTEDFDDDEQFVIAENTKNNNKEILNDETPITPAKNSKDTENPSDDKGSMLKDQKIKINETPTNNNKANTIETVVKYIKVVADTIAKNTQRSFGSKLKYLQDLKNTILANIEDRIEATWPDDVTDGRGRYAREVPRGHVDFPSSESSLMTISFLTFAVFLIKLVLQVIQTYKNNAMMVTPTVLAAVGRAASDLRDQTHN